MHIRVLVGAIMAYASVSNAATSVSNSEMQSWLRAGGVDLANAYAPVYFFGQAREHPPCIPTWAFGGSPTTQDVYDNAHKTSPAPQCQFDDVGCKCRNPGVPIKSATPAFPVYFTFSSCSNTEVRVAYNLFYQKDGAKFGIIATGHDYDWERVIVIHKKGNDGNWSPSEALLSQHSGYLKRKWSDIHGTLTTDEALAGKVNISDVENNDHPMVYVSWSKHAHFDTVNTAWDDVISQSTERAFRNNDWWHFVERKNFIRADDGTDAGKAFARNKWGGGTSNPPYVQKTLCEAGR